MTGDTPRVTAVVLAGGSGTRLGDTIGTGAPMGTNKVYLELDGRAMLAWSLATLDAHPAIVSMVVAVRAGDERVFDEVRHDAGWTTPIFTVVGGSSRSASEHASLELLRPTIEAGGLDLIAIHDGARPFVTADLVDRLVATAHDRGGAVPGLEVDEPVFRVRADEPLADAVDARPMRRVQTPQVFAAATLLRAYDAAIQSGFEGVDTAEVVARFGDLAAVVVPGTVDNIKVTTPDDLVRARQIAERWRQAG